MVRMMNEENVCDNNVEGGAAEGAVDCVSREGVVQALGDMKSEIYAGVSNISMELIGGCGDVWIQVMLSCVTEHLIGWECQPSGSYVLWFQCSKGWAVSYVAAS